jgi:hypothetical protein
MVAILGIVPVAAGAAGVILGSAAFSHAGVGSVDLDSHVRYLSGIFLALGLTFYATIPSIERRTALFRLAAALVVTGGLSRLFGLIVDGAPSAPHLAGLALELVVVPALVVWQGRVARQLGRAQT